MKDLINIFRMGYDRRVESLRESNFAALSMISLYTFLIISFYNDSDMIAFGLFVNILHMGSLLFSEKYHKMFYPLEYINEEIRIY